MVRCGWSNPCLILFAWGPLVLRHDSFGSRVDPSFAGESATSANHATIAHQMQAACHLILCLFATGTACLSSFASAVCFFLRKDTSRLCLVPFAVGPADRFQHGGRRPSIFKGLLWPCHAGAGAPKPHKAGENSRVDIDFSCAAKGSQLSRWMKVSTVHGGCMQLRGLTVSALGFQASQVVQDVVHQGQFPGAERPFEAQRDGSVAASRRSSLQMGKGYVSRGSPLQWFQVEEVEEGNRCGPGRGADFLGVGGMSYVRSLPNLQPYRLVFPIATGDLRNPGQGGQSKATGNGGDFLPVCQTSHGE